MINVTVADDESAVYLNPCDPRGDVYQKLTTHGVLQEVENSSMATLPLSKASALALRQALLGQQVQLEPTHGKILSTVADGPRREAPAALLSRDGQSVIINEPLLPYETFARWSAVKRRGELLVEPLSDGYSQVGREDFPAVLRAMPGLSMSPALRSASRAPAAARHPEAPTLPPSASQGPMGANQGTPGSTQPESSLPAAEIFTEIPATDPFPSYDGTLTSLQNVALTEYAYVQKDLERNAKRPKRAIINGLQKLGINNAFDVLHYFPFRYMDRSNPQLVSRLVEGEQGTIVGTVSNVSVNYSGKTPSVQIFVQDVRGGTISSRFFRQMHLPHLYKKGDQVILYGVVRRWGSTLSIDKAKLEKINADGVTLQVIPVYHQSETHKVQSTQILQMVQETISRIKSQPLPDFLPEQKKSHYRLMDRMDAYQEIHLPSSPESAAQARRRLEYEELLRLQMFIQRRRKSFVERPGTPFPEGDYPMTRAYIESLPYPLTGAQKRALGEIFEKTAPSVPMNCLIQGDVGAGKSTVANATALRAVEAGYQVALMAPTEILAEQLHDGILSSMSGLTSPRSGEPMNIQFLGGKTTAKNKRLIDAALADGSVDVVVGTSSLLFGREFDNLGMVIIDEQHRFGVEQRDALKHVRTDGRTPHLLSMSATPIPRSSAMVVYGDMDLVVLDELPPGRIPIETQWVPVSAQESVASPDDEHWSKIREQVQAGHQAYVVASLVEDNEELAAQSVEDAHDMLSRIIFPEMRVAMVHGKQNRKERTEIMNRFSAGEIDVLVATTVIEVGVNVPNATVMVVMDPGRFGIAQLHQIRGRVGRASFPSVCYLVGEATTDVGVSRLTALVDSTDGFYLAEKDLELRGEGALFGNSQSGESDLKLASLLTSIKTLKVARADAEAAMGDDNPGFDLDILVPEMDAFLTHKEIKS